MSSRLGRWSGSRIVRTTRLERGQVMILAVLFLMIFVFLAAALVDIYAIYEARGWGYQVAQQAALAGASVGRDWSGSTRPPGGGCTGPGPVELDTSAAQNAAVAMMNSEMAQRGLALTAFDIRVLPDYEGGTVAGYPPVPLRLGAGLGNWSSDEPAVGVYLSFPVSTFFMSLVGRSTVPIRVFASASVGQPIGVCPP